MMKQIEYWVLGNYPVLLCVPWTGIKKMACIYLCPYGDGGGHKNPDYSSMQHRPFWLGHNRIMTHNSLDAVLALFIIPG